jgi:4-carboxymuconolactone decarboxylase
LSRVPPLDLDRMTPEQRRLHDDIGGTRSGTARGPFAVWLRTPAIAAKANEFGNALRLEGTLDKKSFEIAVLVVARHWSADYEWFAHEKNALKAGLPMAIISAIRERRVPTFESEEQTLVYETVSELVGTTRLSDASYRRALAFFGLEKLIELVSVAGFYSAVAMMINAFEVPVPGDAKPFGEAR